MNVLVFGSANIDETYTVPHMVRRGETLSATVVVRRSGGKGLNQAIAFARAGASTRFAGLVGEDGRFLLDELASAGVDADLVEVLDDERTGVAVIQNDAAGDNCILLYGGANQRVTPAYIGRVLLSAQPGDLIMLQNEVNVLDQIIERAASAGLRIALNPSPMNENVPVHLLDKVDYLLVNEVEATQLIRVWDAWALAAGEVEEPAEQLDWDTLVAASDWDAIARALGQRFAHATVVLTLGGAGSLLIQDGKVAVRQAALSREVVDTTAAGDTFTGYLLYALISGEDPALAMRRAAAASAIAVARPGAAPSIPVAREVDDALA